MADIGGIMTGIANMANSVVQPISQKRQQERNQKYAKENAKLEAELQLQNNMKTMEQQQAYNVRNYEQQRDDAYAREDYLLANQKALEVQALRNAGFNPALAGGTAGFQPGASVGSASIDAPSGGASGVSVNSPGYGSPFTGLNLGDAVKGALEFGENFKILKAEARKRKAEADDAELKTKGHQEANDFAQFSMLDNLESDEKGFYTTSDNGEKRYIKGMPTTLEGIHSLQTFQKMRAEGSEHQSREVANNLDKMVKSLQITDPDILSCLSSMPSEVYKNLKSKTSLQDIQTALTHVEKDVKENEKAFWTKLGELDSDALKFIASAIYTFRK
ncbi:MAG: hypothetical protein QXI16_01610 [Sulfolobaceae archaeon]